MGVLLLIAALGGSAASVDADRVHVQGALVGIRRVDTYTVHEMQSSAGTAIREYVSPSGTVFAVAWDGPYLPDLRQLLGPYFDAYQRGATRARAARRGHGPLSIADGDLVVQVSGHMRAFSGRAYLGRLVPPNVRDDAIK